MDIEQTAAGEDALELVAVQVWISWQQRAGTDGDGVRMHALLLLIAEPRIGLRPGRIEPRQRKRRNNSFPLMTKPRSEAREEVRLNGHAKKQRQLAPLLPS